MKQAESDGARYGAMSIAELRAIWFEPGARPRMGQIWQYYLFRQRMVTRIVETAAGIDLLGLQGTPAEANVMADLILKGAIFDDPESSHRLWVCNPFGEPRLPRESAS